MNLLLLTVTKQWDLILSIQKPSSTRLPVLLSSSLSWPRVNGRTWGTNQEDRSVTVMVCVKRWQHIVEEKVHQMVTDDRMSSLSWGCYLASGAPLWLKFRHFAYRPKLFLFKIIPFWCCKKVLRITLVGIGAAWRQMSLFVFYLHETLKHTFSDAIIKKAKLVIRCVMSRLEDTPQMCSASQTYDEAWLQP